MFGKIYGASCISRVILSKLETQFGQVANSVNLFQTFYQMVQEKNKKIQTFATGLEGSLNQLRLR